MLREQLSLLRTLVARSQEDEEKDLLDFKTLTSEEELQVFHQQIENGSSFRKRMVGWCFMD